MLVEDEMIYEVSIRMPKKQANWIMQVDRTVRALDCGDMDEKPAPDVYAAALRLYKSCGTMGDYDAGIDDNDFDYEGGKLTINCDRDQAEPRYVAELIQQWIRKFDPERVEGFMWAMGPRGGAIVITAKKIKSFDAEQWLGKELARLTKTNLRAKARDHGQINIEAQPTP